MLGFVFPSSSLKFDVRKLLFAATNIFVTGGLNPLPYSSSLLFDFVSNVAV